MTVRFTKMQGAGNDYLFLDGFADEIPADLPGLARRISDRRLGVGADGLIVVEPSIAADFAMRVFNADGSAAELCGNGLRCAFRYLRDRARIDSDRVAVQTGAGILSVGADPRRAGWVSSEMPEPHFGEVVSLDVGPKRFTVHEVTVGNPHAVIFLAPGVDLDRLDLVALGPAIARHERYPDGVNVEFVALHDRSRVAQRTWERGSGETLACGTGACAVVAAGIASGRLDAEVSVRLRGGTLCIGWASEGRGIEMAGPAREVFSGVWTESVA